MPEKECVCFEKNLADHTAPTLLGIKCANLISLSRSEFDIRVNTRLFNSKAASKNLEIKILCECRSRALLLVYNKPLLQNHIRQPE